MTKRQLAIGQLRARYATTVSFSGSLLYPARIMANEEEIRHRLELLLPHLDERTRRLALGAEAEAIGFGGISSVSRATGIARQAVSRGIEELKVPAAGVPRPGIRRPGGGRKKTVDVDPTLKEDLKKLIDPTERGDPESPLLWTSKSLRHLAEELKSMGHQVSYRIVADILHGPSVIA